MIIQVRKLVLALTLAAASVGLIAAPAAAQEATVCVKAKVVANGMELVNVDECHTVPPAAP